MSVADKNSPHEMADAKIHIMQHDLDEIAKNGSVTLETPAEKTPRTPKKVETPPTMENLPADSPFSQPIYPASNEPLPEEKIASHEPETPREFPRETIQRRGSLNLPTFHAASAPAFRQAPSRETTTANPAPEKLESTPPYSQRAESAKQLPEKQESIRTGTWPIEPPKVDPEKKPAQSTKSPAKKVSIRKAITDKSALSDNIILKDGWGWGRTVAVAVIMFLIGGGGYYFWKTRLQNEGVPEISLSSPLDTTSNPSADALRTESEKDLPFSTVHANTFLVDVDTESVSTLREKLMKDAATMKAAGMKGPIPFSVVDKTNTPIAFFMFASVFNLGLSGSLLNSLDNDFTLSLFLDGDLPRLALAITLKTPADAKKFLSASEKTLPISLKNILLVDPAPSAPAPKFSDGSYRNIPVRYFNFPLDPSLSLDYALTENTLVIGTSKNSARAVIDMMLDQKQ